MEKQNSCRFHFTGSVSVSDENSLNYYSLSKEGFNKIKNDGKTPIAVDESQKFYAFKGMNDEGLTVEIRKSETSKTIELEHDASSVLSGCFLNDGSFAMLLVNDESSLKRSYVVSVSDKGYSEFTGYTVGEENTKDLFRRLLSLGAVIERPTSIQCHGDNIYILSHRIFSDMMTVVVHKLDRSAKKIEFVTGYHPIKTKSKVSLHFQEKDNTLYVYSENKLVMVRGLSFPANMMFNEPGEVLFLDDREGVGTYLYFIPDNKAPGESQIRQIRF